MPDPSSPKRVLMHIGGPKTGSTSIQAALFKHSEENLLPGIDYCLPFPESMNSQHLLLWGLFRAPEQMPRWPRFEIARRGGIEAIRGDLEACWARMAGCHNLVLSSESLSFWTVPELTALRERLEADGFSSIRPLVYVRDPVGYYLSMIQQEIKASPRFQSPVHFRPRYRNTIAKFTNLFGRVEVRVFDRDTLVGGCVVKDFISMCEGYFGLPLGTAAIDVTAHNSSVSAEAMILLQRWNRDHNPAGEMNTSIKRIIDLVDQVRESIPQTPARLNPAVRALIAKGAAAEVEQLRGLGVVFPQWGAVGDAGAASAPADLAAAGIDLTDIATMVEGFDPAVLRTLEDYVAARF